MNDEKTQVKQETKIYLARHLHQRQAFDYIRDKIETIPITNARPFVVIDALSADEKDLNPKTYHLTHVTREMVKTTLPFQTGITNLDKIATIISSNAGLVDFNAYIDAMGGNSERYIKDGVSKIPKEVISVVVIDYLLTLARIVGYTIAKIDGANIGANNYGMAYLFNGKQWLPVNSTWITNLVKDVIVKMGYDPVEATTKTLQKTLLDTFWLSAPKAPEPASETIININNGTLVINADGSVKRRDFNQQDFMHYCLPYDYNPKAEATLFMAYLKRVLPERESRNVLQELFGAVFIRNINLEKIGVLLGTGSNGKSVLMRIVTTLLGSVNVSHMDLKSLSTDKNADNNRAQLEGKLLNFAPEINAKSHQEHDLIKRLASGEPIQIKRLYQNTTTIKDYAKLIFNANVMPSDVEHTNGFFRRFLIVAFDQTISDDEKDLTLSDKIIASELPAVLNWMIEGAKRLQQNKRFSKCRKSEEMSTRYKTESDPVSGWLNEHGYTNDAHSSRCECVLASSIREGVNWFAMENGYHPLNSKTTCERLRGLGFKERKGKPAAFYMTKKQTTAEIVAEL